MSMSLPQSFAFLDSIAIIAVVLAVIILVTSADDILVDFIYWGRRLVRAYLSRRWYKPLTTDQLRAAPEKPMAIIVPAWHESDVIATMLENLISTIEYGSYVLFIGTYPNDPGTIAEVDRMCRRFRQLRRVEVPHPGPTCKADCLNAVIQALLDHERQSGIKFAGIVMHDAEDVLHPFELKYFNYLMPRMDLIQIPVASLERKYLEFVAGTYMDEFAEWHAKDMVVREFISGIVPSAGVGTCFSRKALTVLCEETDNHPFNVESLAEDYDIGTRLGARGMKSIFARYNVQFLVTRRTWFGWGRNEQRVLTMPLCVREYFPNRFRAAYRQRARWALGISFQGWQQIGWTGYAEARFLLYRDRKVIFTPFVAMVGYVVFAILAAYWLWGGEWFAAWRASSTIFASPIAQWLMLANFVLVLWRIAHRMYFVNQIYGFDHAVLAIPRMVVNNFITFASVLRAWHLFLAHVFLGKRLTWDKTAHDFPELLERGVQRRRLGELLTMWQAIDDAKLTEALVEHKSTAKPLGRVLLSRGWIDEETLADAIAYQAGALRAAPTFPAFSRVAGRLPADICTRLAAIVIDETEGRPVVAVPKPLAETELAELRLMLGRDFVQQIATEEEIAAGLDYVVAAHGHRARKPA